MIYFIFFTDIKKNGTNSLNLQTKSRFSSTNFKKRDSKNDNYSTYLNKAKQVTVSSDAAKLEKAMQLKL